MNTTIVSGFIGNMNNRDVSDYLTRGKLLLELPYPKIIFMESCNIKLLKDYENKYTIFVPFNKDEIIFMNKIPKNVILPAGRNKDKDTLNYILVQNNKTEWVRNAIELNKFDTPNYMWIDFGLTHVLKNYLHEFSDIIGKCVSKKYNKLRIGHINNLDSKSVYGLNLESSQKYDYPLWFFAGGVFGGDKDNLLKFADLCKNKLSHILNINRITWEVNIWHFVYLENKEIFYPYKCNHDVSIIKQY